MDIRLQNAQKIASVIYVGSKDVKKPEKFEKMPEYLNTLESGIELASKDLKVLKDSLKLSRTSRLFNFFFEKGARKDYKSTMKFIDVCVKQLGEQAKAVKDAKAEVARRQANLDKWEPKFKLLTSAVATHTKLEENNTAILNTEKKIRQLNSKIKKTADPDAKAGIAGTIAGQIHALDVLKDEQKVLRKELKKLMDEDRSIATSVRTGAVDVLRSSAEGLKKLIEHHRTI